MLTIKNYVRPQTLEEAYQLCQKRSNVVLGGMLWLKMENKNVQTAIDLSDLGLDTIEESESGYAIGAMVSLRTLETHEALNQLTDGALRESVRHIVGVQFRNTATIGGSIYGRFGFSDVLTLFQVLGAEVELFQRGRMPIAEFAALPHSIRDILVRIYVPKRAQRVAYLSQRNTATDFPVLAVAVSECDGVYTCAVGARPYRAVACTDERGILRDGITGESAGAFGADVAERISFGSNVRAGAAYRKRICAVLVRRALLRLEEV